MYGIAGMAVFVDQPSPSESLGRRMIEVIRHRGPELAEHTSARADRREAPWQVICLELWTRRLLDAAQKGT